jgi:site-specific recombinase XerD
MSAVAGLDFGEWAVAAAAPETLALVVAPETEFDAEAILRAFHEWIDLDVGDGKASRETVAAYMTDLRQHLGWLAEQGLTPARAGKDDLKIYRAHLVETYQVTTVGRKLASIRRFYKMALERGLLAVDPSAGLKAPKDRTDKSERIKYVPVAVLQRLFAAPGHSAKGLRDRAILLMMAIHGLRVCEIARADLADLDLAAGEAGTLRVLGKGDKWRTVLLTEETREELRHWLAARELIHTRSTAVFVNMHWNHAAGSNRADNGQRMTTRGIRGMVDGYLERVGAKKEGVSCHALRHSYATLSLAAGAELLAISQSMGHSSVTTTQVYAKIVDKAKKNPAKFLVGLL